MALPLAWQIINIAGWVALQITDIFENIGVVQEGMMTIARPIALVDRPQAPSARGDARRDRVRGRALRLRPRTGVHRRPSADGRAGREDRPGRPLRRRQVDRGQSAAALLRSRRRPHPDRRPGHRRRDAGEPAGADLGGDAGHLAAAPLDPRQHPLRPPGRERRRGRSPPPSSPMRTSSSSTWRTGRTAAATTPRSASAASSCRAASASASPSRA